MYKIVLVVLCTFFTCVDAQEMSEELAAVQTLKISTDKKKLLAATKVIIDGSNKKAWARLIQFLNDTNLFDVRGPSHCGVGYVYRKIDTDFDHYMDIIYSSEN
mgnify:CR=1 FL=1